MTKRAMRKPHIFKEGGKWYWSPPVYKYEIKSRVELTMIGKAWVFVESLNYRLRHVDLGQS